VNKQSITLKHLAISAAMILAVACGVSKKVTYDFPSTMSEQVKEGYIEQFNKGKILYGINCAKCHNVKVKGREVIPDFTYKQLSGYEMRVGNAQHMENLPESKVAEDEIVSILTFLRYKKKIGIGIDSTGKVVRTGMKGN
jgi:hypothetical protein